jgi:hypothetical protein
MGQEYKYHTHWETITVTQGVVQDNQFQQWHDQTQVHTTGSATEVQIMAPPMTSSGPCWLTGTFSVQDQISESLTPVVPPSTLPPQPYIIAGSFMGTGNVEKQLAPSGSPTALPGGTELSGTHLTMGQLMETVTCPATDPTAPPTTVTEAFMIQAVGMFDEVLLNPKP